MNRGLSRVALLRTARRSWQGLLRSIASKGEKLFAAGAWGAPKERSQRPVPPLGGASRLPAANPLRLRAAVPFLCGRVDRCGALCVPETQERKQTKEQPGDHHRVTHVDGDRRDGPPAHGSGGLGQAKVTATPSSLGSESCASGRRSSSMTRLAGCRGRPNGSSRRRSAAIQRPPSTMMGSRTAPGPSATVSNR
jgi:hypothetical protein